jgi:hypothetical protein
MGKTDHAVYGCPGPLNFGQKERSRGLWQINDCWHSEVSDPIAYSEVSSTIWALEWIKSGHADQWSTWLHRKGWFGSQVP